jgi:hypothetical protein
LSVIVRVCVVLLPAASVTVIVMRSLTVRALLRALRALAVGFTTRFVWPLATVVLNLATLTGALALRFSLSLRAVERSMVTVTVAIPRSLLVMVRRSPFVKTALELRTERAQRKVGCGAVLGCGCRRSRGCGRLRRRRRCRHGDGERALGRTQPGGVLCLVGDGVGADVAGRRCVRHARPVFGDVKRAVLWVANEDVEGVAVGVLARDVRQRELFA